ncbi:MAG TPA: transaldolase [Candidatus Latescibacteria bacterium]|nr:transaldolase [Candidatus Latescibacterota bacterium]
MHTSRGDVYRLASCVERFESTLRGWSDSNATDRLWGRDTSLWTGADEDRWLDWLTAVDRHRPEIDQIRSLAREVRDDGITDCLLLGMGGSSLCPEVVSETFGPQPQAARLHVLDSTLPDQVRRLRDSLDLAHTLVVVASKSGSTVEPNVLLDYFEAELSKVVDVPGRHIAAVTDPGSALEARAVEGNFRSVLAGVPQIGGRFSALSNFGILPAGLAGVDLNGYLDHAGDMTEACRGVSENPGVLLGAALGAAYYEGRDKVTLVVSPGLWEMGAWIEQLVAESTGKVGVGLCPVNQEPVLDVTSYGSDRVFTYIRLASEPEDAQDAFIDSLSRAGHPTITLSVEDVERLGAEFYRWEFAVAVAGSLMEINPFDQPNVQESKEITSALLAGFDADGALNEPAAVGDCGGLRVTTTVPGDSPERALAEILSSIRVGDYLALLAYCDRTDEAQATFQRIRKQIGTTRRVATTLGYGPRFLHSTGQLHKGGPNTGVFLQVTTSPDEDLAIPGKSATFGILSRAQALGDYQALSEKGRRVIRFDMREGLTAGLHALESLIMGSL